LNVIPIAVPPLRERREDIASLADHFAGKYAAAAGQPRPFLEPEFIAGLEQHPWPGNVRELSNVMRRVLALANGGVIGPEYLGPGFLKTPVSGPANNFLRPGIAMRDVEKHLLETTLQATHGNRTRAAELLGISVRTIRNKIREYGLPPRSYAP